MFCPLEHSNLSYHRAQTVQKSLLWRFSNHSVSKPEPHAELNQSCARKTPPEIRNSSITDGRALIQVSALPSEASPSEAPPSKHVEAGMDWPSSSPAIIPWGWRLLYLLIHTELLTTLWCFTGRLTNQCFDRPWSMKTHFFSRVEMIKGGRRMMRLYRLWRQSSFLFCG